MTFPLDIPGPVRRALPPGTGVLLGISGGVDSAVTLALLASLGCEVQCVTFKNVCFAEGDDPPGTACCSLDAIEDARAQARTWGASHWVRNIEEPFTAGVIQPFLLEYAAGRTPNPCLQCNSDIRFPELVRLARRQGCSFAATGHYARIERSGDGPARLLRGLDPQKDQSYFLHRLDPGLLGGLVFPLGWYTKPQVRAAAAELGIAVAEKPDSVEICFVPDGDRTAVFADMTAAGEPATEPGDIVDAEGRVLGRHRGLIHYTVGQRKGLGIAAPNPLYVVALDLAGRRLIVGEKADLAVTSLEGDRFHALVEDLPSRWEAGQPLPASWKEPAEVVLRIRHRHAGAAVRSWTLDGDRLAVELARPAEGAAPGQGMVLYAGDLVLGGARILEARPGTGET
ncbi:tRNA 2-thiouridine(34) synthase MnmA [bacterium]|nr:tRNA 2-thiouridine(34) synthase MnmA [bacterium]